MTQSLSEQASEFAESLTHTIQAVVGPSCAAFQAVAVEGADAFAVRQSPADGVLLSDGEGPILRISVDYLCTLDGRDHYLAVESSKVHVFVEPDGRQPLFRYEYERSIGASLPAAHIQFHGTHPELEQAIKDCGDSTQRAKRRRLGKKPPLLSALHFPVGGSRFRPTLEDVMEMLIEEFGVHPDGPVKEARRKLAEGREDWRRKQVATVVRDAPSEAVRALTEMGYLVEPPPSGVTEDKPNKLRTF